MNVNVAYLAMVIPDNNVSTNPYWEDVKLFCPTAFEETSG
jgi:hypothetical protein